MQQQYLWFLLLTPKYTQHSASISSKVSLDHPEAAALPVGAPDEHQGVCKQQQHHQQTRP